MRTFIGIRDVQCEPTKRILGLGSDLERWIMVESCSEHGAADLVSVRHLQQDKLNSDDVETRLPARRFCSAMKGVPTPPYSFLPFQSPPIENLSCKEKFDCIRFENFRICIAQNNNLCFGNLK
jgi:hypothetical protein